jgi:hypothetical protein
VPDLPLIKVGRVLSDARQEGPDFLGALFATSTYPEMKSNVSETPRTAVRGVGRTRTVPTTWHGCCNGQCHARKKKLLV